MKSFIQKIIFGYLLVICFGVWSAKIYDYFTPYSESVSPEPEELKPCPPFFVDIIPVENAAGIENRDKEFSSPIHSSTAWLRAEKSIKNPKILENYLKSQQKRDSIYNQSLHDAYALRMKMIKNSRTAYRRMQYDWGEILSGSVHGQYQAFICEHGIVIKVAKKFYFFHNAAIERMPQKSEDISIMKGADGYWYPAIQKDSTYFPLTYWGEVQNIKSPL